MSRGGRIAVATLMALPMFVVLIGLGIWQLQRLEQKQEIIALRDRGFNAPPTELSARDSSPAAMAWRRVTVTGRFDHANEFHLWRTHDGDAGYDILTPMVRTDSAAGQTVLIDRGWVPLNRKDPATRREGQLEGAVTVRGYVRVDLDVRGPMTPTNDVAGNIWYAVDYGAMGERAGGAFLRPLVVVADATPNPGGLPLGSDAPPPIPNRHLEYALTWFALAGALVVIFVLSIRRQLAKGSATA